MPRCIRTVRVSPIPNEPLRFHVESWSRPGETHVVDLGARYPMGRCSCESYTCTLWPEFKRTLRPRYCRHIESARTYLCNRRIRELAGLNPNDPDGE